MVRRFMNHTALAFTQRPSVDNRRGMASASSLQEELDTLREGVMKHARDVASSSGVVRLSLWFLAMCLGIDALASITTGTFTMLAVWWALIVLFVAYVGYRSGATWARDPLVATRGRAPALTTSFAKVRSQTETLPMPPAIADQLETDLASARKQNRDTRIVLSVFCALLGVAAALLLRWWLPLVTAFVTGALYAATLTALVPWLIRDLHSDLGARTLRRTSGPVKVEWFLARGGYYWTLRIGDRELTTWDDRLGRQLANMPWGTATYTESRRLIDLRDLDDNVIFSHPTRPAPEYWTGTLLWFVPLALLIPFVFAWVSLTAIAAQIIGR